MSEYVLEARNIVKTFPGVKALSNVDLQVKKGEVHAVVGENGAGKSTLMMTLSGVYQPDEGELFIEGKKQTFLNSRDSIEAGIGIVFQELSLVMQLSVAENIYFNRQPVNKLGFLNKKKLNEDAQQMLKTFDISNIDPKTLTKDLSIANQQVVEILKAMSEKPKVLILDEPTSSLTEVEVKQLFHNIRMLKNQGISFIYISHHLKEIFEIADRVTILRDGEKIVTRDIGEIDEDYLISNMVGRSIENIYGSRSADDAVGQKIFEVKGLTQKGKFKDVNLSIHAGEIVGLYGLVGAGRTELGMAIFGMSRIDSGEMFLNGQKIHLSSPKDAINNGVAYMTEDRKTLGLYLEFNILQNLAANRLWDFTSAGFISDKKLNAAGERSVSEFGVITPSVKQKVKNLSGGNQQKVLLANWVGTQPKLLIVDEPTRGVDVGAKCEIYQLLRKLAATLGCAILMISSDLPEILGVSDRVYVMKQGEIVGELKGSDATEQAVIKYAASSN